MSYERVAKRMDVAVESSWLRSLRSQGRERPATPRHRFVPTPASVPKQVPVLRDRTVTDH